MAEGILYQQRRRGKDGNVRLTSVIERRVPTQAELQSRYRYDPETGAFSYLVKCGKYNPGDDAGGKRAYDGYSLMRVFNTLFRAHRLAFLYMTGELPEKSVTIDHINGVRNDNRWCNLRVATMEQQSWNRAAGGNCKSGLIGAWPCKTTGRWQSIITIGGGKRLWLGRFDTAQDAHEAWIKKAIVIRGIEWVRQAVATASILAVFIAANSDPVRAHDWFVGKNDPVTGGSCCTTAANAKHGDCAMLNVEPGVLTGDELGYRLRLTPEQAGRINPNRKVGVDTIIPWARIQNSEDGNFYVCIPGTPISTMNADFYCFWAPPSS